MTARIPPQNKLTSDIVAIIEELAQERGKEYARIEREKMREKLFLFDLMLFCVHEHKVHGHAETRNIKVIESIIQDRDAEDDDVLLKHTLDYAEKIGLSFLVKEWKKYD